MRVLWNWISISIRLRESCEPFFFFWENFLGFSNRYGGNYIIFISLPFSSLPFPSHRSVSTRKRSVEVAKDSGIHHR